ncbi:hypothetical protein GMSM_46400 [Geomonas sp. Red276]
MTIWSSLRDKLRQGVNSGTEVSRERFNALPYRYQQFDMALAWEIRRSEKETVVDGILKNLRYAFMEGIELWVAATGPGGSVRARAACYITPHELRQDELAPFTVPD